ERAADGPKLESPPADRRPERHMEPVRHPQLAHHVPDRPGRDRNHRPRLRRLPLGGGPMAQTLGIRMKNPAHPGGFVKPEIIEPLGLSVTDAAQARGITRAALSAFLNERAALSPDMAIRIEKAFGVSMETLMRMQNSFDIAQAHKREGEIAVVRYVPKAGTS